MLVIHQPNFLPRLKILQKISASSTWVLLDSVQFAKRDWQNRTMIKPLDIKTDPFWISLAVKLKCGLHTKIFDVRVIDHERALKKITKTIHYTFKASPHWKEVDDYWSEVIASINSDFLVDFGRASTLVALKRYSSAPALKYSSNLNVRGSKSKLIANICNILNSKNYIADSGAANYLSQSDFEGIDLFWQHWPEVHEILTPQRSMWRNVTFLSFLATYGADVLTDHLSSISLKKYPPTESIG